QRADSRAWRWRLWQSDDVRGERAPGGHVHLRPIDQPPTPGGQRGAAGRSGAAVGRDARTPTAVRRVLVSGRPGAGGPPGGSEGGGERARAEPPLRGDDPRGCVAVSGSDL